MKPEGPAPNNSANAIRQEADFLVQRVMLVFGAYYDRFGLAIQALTTAAELVERERDRIEAEKRARRGGR